MLRRVQKKGRNQGRPFWGCSGYPHCTAIIPIDAETPSQ
ncbi:MAG: hypothetical protein J6C59_03095 [Muribaculaceae bacterium]|nr:hypothetical protein [Muribaculaceae bacterium]